MFHTGNKGTWRWSSMYSRLQQLLRAPARIETARVNSENHYKRKWTGPGGEINSGSPIWWSELYFVQTGGFTSYPTAGRVEGNTCVWPQHFGISKVTRKVWTKLEAVYTYHKENVRLLEVVQQNLPATKRERREIILRSDVISGFYGTSYEQYVLNYGTWRRVLCEIPRRCGQYVASKFRYRTTGRHNPKDAFASLTCAWVRMSITPTPHEAMSGVTWGTDRGHRNICNTYVCTSSLSPEKRKCPHLFASLTRWCVVVGK